MDFNFGSEDVRVKDGILQRDGTIVDDTAIIAINTIAVDTGGRSPSPANSGGGRNSANSGDWYSSVQSSWPDYSEPTGRDRQSKSRQTRNQTIQCYNCKAFGHLSRDCSQPSRRRDNSNRGTNKRRFGGDDDRQQSRANANAKQWSDQMTSTGRFDDEVSELNLFPQLEEYYLSQFLSDIQIDIDGQTLFGHKFVLSAKSDVFKDILFGKNIVTGTDPELAVSKDQMEATVTEGVIRLEDTNVEAFKLMLKFLYFEDLRLIDENAGNYQMAIEVLKLSKRFQIDRLLTLMEKVLIEWLAIDNFVDICKLSIDSESKQLSNSLEAFIQRNETQIIEKKSFINESIEVMAKILESMRTQKSIIDALTLIIESNPEIDVSSLKRFIDFKSCSVEDIDVLKKIGLFDEKELFEILRQKYDELLNEKKFNYN